MKKFLSIFLIFNFLGVINSGCEGCPPEKFTDFKSIELRVENPNVSVNQNFKFAILRANLIYLTASRTNMNFGGALFAFSPCEAGYMGERYGISNISIKSNRSFSANLAAGSELRTIVYLDEQNSITADRTVAEVQTYFVLKNNLYIKAKPILNKKHIFKIEVEKSNGEIYQTTTEEITFE